MKRKSGEIDLSGWSLGSIDELHKGMEQLLLAAARDVLGLALDSEFSYIAFPAVWAGAPGSKYSSDGQGGPAVDDPLTMYLVTGLGGSESNGPTYSFSLRESLQTDMAWCVRDGSGKHGLGLLSTALRDLASEIDSAIAAAPDDEEE